MSDQHKLRVKPLLSQLRDDGEYDVKVEERAAELETSIIELERQAYFQEYLKSGVTAVDVEFERELIQFALKRKISFLNPHWRDKAMHLAASEHPDLDPRKRRRGRPSKTESGSVILGRLVGRNLEKTPAELGAVEFVQEWFRKRRGKEISDAAACRVIVALPRIVQLSGITNWRPGDAYFASQVRKLQNRVSKQRKLVGRSKRRIIK